MLILHKLLYELHFLQNMNIKLINENEHKIYLIYENEVHVTISTYVLKTILDFQVIEE